VSVETDLRGYILLDETVMSLVGNRMYARVLPQNVVYPAISYYLASVVENRDLSGPGGKERARITINCWSESYVQTKVLAKAVKVRINGFAGTIGTTKVTHVHLENEMDVNEEEAGEVGSSGVYGVLHDFIVAHHNV